MLKIVYDIEATYSDKIMLTELDAFVALDLAQNKDQLPEAFKDTSITELETFIFGFYKDDPKKLCKEMGINLQKIATKYIINTYFSRLHAITKKEPKVTVANIHLEVDDNVDDTFDSKLEAESCDA